MAFTGSLVPDTRIEEAQDGMGFKIFDESTWGTGDQAAVSSMKVAITYINDDEESIVFDDLEIIVGGDKTKFNQFLSSSGLLIESSDLHVDAIDIDEVFPDGYYEITIKLNDGSYSAGTEPYYKNIQAFLATFRAMRRTMSPSLLVWPITIDIREKNYDIYTLGLYLDMAEYSADLGKKVQFRTLIAAVRSLLEFYEVPIPW